MSPPRTRRDISRPTILPEAGDREPVESDVEATPGVEGCAAEAGSDESLSTDGSGVRNRSAAEQGNEEPPNAVDRDIELPANENAPSATPADATAEVDRAALKRALESLIFVSDRIVTAAQLARAIKSRAAQVRELLAELREDYRGRGIELVEVSNGYQFRSSPASAAYVREFVAQKPVRLTRAQLETLALIAYRQPVTRPEIDEIRGVDSGSAMRVLLERGLIKMIGRKDEAGRPLLYGTAPDFLEFFGLRSLHELPTLREFTELSQENRALFKRKTGEEVEVAEAELAAAEEAAREDDVGSAHVSDEDLAALAAEGEAAEAAESKGDSPTAEKPANEGGDVGTS
jgi:segregation and condensation protein B